MSWAGLPVSAEPLEPLTFEAQQREQWSRCLLVLERERIPPHVRSLMAEMAVAAIALGKLRFHDPGFRCHSAYARRNSLQYLSFSYDELGRPVGHKAGTVYAAPILQPVESSQGAISSGWEPSGALEYVVGLPERRPVLEAALARLESRGVL